MCVSLYALYHVAQIYRFAVSFIDNCLHRGYLNDLGVLAISIVTTTCGPSGKDPPNCNSKP